MLFFLTFEDKSLKVSGADLSLGAKRCLSTHQKQVGPHLIRFITFIQSFSWRVTYARPRLTSPAIHGAERRRGKRTVSHNNSSHSLNFTQNTERIQEDSAQ